MGRPCAPDRGRHAQWFIREPTDKGKSKLHKNDDPVKDWWLQIWDCDNTDASRKEYRVRELANALVKLVADEGNRRALWAWAMSKAGTLNADDYVVRQTKKFGKLGSPCFRAYFR